MAYTCYPDTGNVKWKPFELYLLESLSLTTYILACIRTCIGKELFGFKNKLGQHY